MSAGGHTVGRSASTHMVMMGSTHGVTFAPVTKDMILEATFKPAPQLFSRGRTSAEAGGPEMFGFQRGRINLLR